MPDLPRRVPCVGNEVHGTSMPCAHNFHAECIDEWLRPNFKCPLDVAPQASQTSTTVLFLACIGTQNKHICQWFHNKPTFKSVEIQSEPRSLFGSVLNAAENGIVIDRVQNPPPFLSLKL